MAFIILRFALAELPALAAGMLFWAGVLAKLADQTLGVKAALWLAVVLSTAGVIFLLRDRWSHLRRSLLERQVARATAPVCTSRDAVHDWAEAVPDTAAVAAIEALAATAAGDWASDGILNSITYYIKSEGSSPRLDLQVDAYSAIRGETCDLEFGEGGTSIGILSAADTKPRAYCSILSFENWREAWLMAIEASARTVSESSFGYVQVYVFASSIHFSFMGLSDARRLESTIVFNDTGELADRDTGRIIHQF